MNFTPLTPEQWLAKITLLIPLGWMPVGGVGCMTFRKNERNYDLSAADLTRLEYIEANGIFLLP